MNKWNYVKPKSLLHCKRNDQQNFKMEENTCNHISKKLIFKIYKELKQFSSKKTKQRKGQTKRSDLNMERGIEQTFPKI